MSSTDRMHNEIRFWVIVTFLVLVGIVFSRLLTSRAAPSAPIPEITKVPIPPPTWDGTFPCVSDVLIPNPAKPQIGKCTIAPDDNAPVERFEADLRFGRFVLRQTDLFVADDIPIVLTRTYNSLDWVHRNPTHAFGRNTNHRYDIAPLGTRNPYTYQVILFEDGDYVYFPRISPGTSFSDAVYRHSETSGLYYSAVQQWDGNGWKLTRPDGLTILFPDSYSATNTAQGGPFEITNAAGAHLILKRNQLRDLEEIRTEHDHFVRFTYDDQHRIVRADSDAGDWRQYRYNSIGMLTDVIAPSGVMRHYEYDGVLMTSVTDGHGHILVRNKYDNGILAEQEFPSVSKFVYEYQKKPRYFELATVRLPNGSFTTVDVASSISTLIKQPPPQVGN